MHHRRTIAAAAARGVIDIDVLQGPRGMARAERRCRSKRGVLGPRLGELLAGGYAVLAYLHGPPGQDEDPVWVWALRRGTDEQSHVLSGALLALGVAEYAASGARRDVAERALSAAAGGP